MHDMESCLPLAALAWLCYRVLPPRKDSVRVLLLKDGIGYQKSHSLIQHLDSLQRNIAKQLRNPCHSYKRFIFKLTSRQIEDLIQVHITNITKVEFFYAFHAAHLALITEGNIRGGF